MKKLSCLVSLFIAAALSGCQGATPMDVPADGGSTTTADMTPVLPPPTEVSPASSSLNDLVPAAIAGSKQLHDTQHFGLSKSQTASRTVAGVALTRYEQNAAHLRKDAGQMGMPGLEGAPARRPSWSFGATPAMLNLSMTPGKMGWGDFAMLATAQFFRTFLEQQVVKNAVQKALNTYPNRTMADLTQALSVSGLKIESIVLSDGHVEDMTKTGNFAGPNTMPHSMITINFTLRDFLLYVNGAQTMPVCDSLLKTTIPFTDAQGNQTALSPAQYAQTVLGTTFIAPSLSVWSNYLRVQAHFFIEDMTSAHKMALAYRNATGYRSTLTADAVKAAAMDLGIIQDLITTLFNGKGMPTFDVSIDVAPSTSLEKQTLVPLSVMAKAAGNIDCLRQVDGWLVGPSLMQHGMSMGHLAGATPPSFWIHGYDKGVDMADGQVDPGVSCLHDEQGNVVQVADKLACSTPSGALRFSDMGGIGTKNEGPSRGANIVGPYRALELAAARKPALDQSLPAEERGPSEHLFGGVTCCDKIWRDCCSARFGRGTRFCLTEMFEHDEVADYWNIHYYQSFKYAAIQDSIWAADFLLTAAIQAGRDLLKAGLQGAIGTSFEELLINTLIKNLTVTYVKTQIIQPLLSVVDGIQGGSGSASADRWTELLQGIITGIKGDITIVKGLLGIWGGGIFADSLAQMAMNAAAGWQDISNASHCKCGFEYNDPDYCNGNYGCN